VVRLEVVLPNGEIINATRDSNPPLAWFTGKEGTTGIITEIELSVRPAPEVEGHHVLIFPNRETMAEAARLIANAEPRPYSMHYADASYHQILADGGFTVPAIKPGLTVDYDGDANTIAAGAQKVAEIVAKVGGQEMPSDVARHEWNTRFWALRSKRQGPSVLAAEVWLPIEKLADFIRDVDRFGKGMGITMYNYGSVVAPGYVTAFAMYRANEGSVVDYMLSLSVTKRLHDIGKRHGGHPYGIGLWNAAYLKDIFSADTIAELRARKKQLDPLGILNPGKVYQTLTLLPRPLFQFGMGAMSLVRGFTSRILGEPPKPEFPQAEPVHGKEERPAYAGLMEEAMICAQCGYCRSVCPIYSTLGWESTAPRGKLAAT
jgi:glycolate oxidase